MKGETRPLAAVIAAAILLAPAATAQERPSLELSMDEAVERALKNNADLAVEKYRPEMSKEDERAAKGAYDFFLDARIDKNSSTDPARNAFTGGEKVDTDTWTWNFGGQQLLKTGGVVRVDFLNNETDTNNVFASFNPTYGSFLNLALTQPLLRDRSIDLARQQLKVTKNNREISDTDFRETVINTVATVKKAYYDVIAAIDNLEAQRKSLSLAQKLLEENRIKVRVGTLAPLDVVQAESEVAGREEGVINAETLLAAAEDNIKQAIFPQNDPAAWALRILPTDRPSADPRPVDTDAAIKNALANRTDIAVARKAIDTTDVNLRFAKSQTLPTLDLVAAYGATGVGGTQLIRDGLGGPVIDTIPGGYGDAVDDVFGRDFPTWTLGVNVAYPLFNRTAKANQARARLTKDQAIASLNRLELQVVAEVRAAGRNVEANYKRVESTRAARILQERRLDAEEKKFAAGMSTNFLVTQAQRDLADASVAEIRAILDYRKSLIEFDRVQEAGSVAISLVNVGTATSR
ncbi:MAG TPA: TolC family protein [Vicinamibacteria bacterium]|nr:TolC family protein [Vicinamibacteria bacterium]